MSDFRPVAFDIETIIDPSVIPFLPPVKPDARMTPGGEKYLADIEAKKAAQLEHMPLDPRFNLVAVLGWCDGKKSGHLILKDEGNEKEFLSRAWKVLGQYNFFLSFNGIEFDVPCIRLHTIRHGIAMEVKISTRKYAVENHLDCYAVLSDWQRRPGGMDFYAQYFGVGHGKDAIDGGSVQELWDMGEHETIGQYCESDARQTWAIGQKIMPYYI